MAPEQPTPADGGKERRVNEKLDGRARSILSGLFASPQQRLESGAGWFSRLTQNVYDAGRLLTDDRYRMPTVAKLKIVACLVYAIWPLDMISDVIFPVGFLDDAAVLAYAAKVMGDVAEDYRRFVARVGPYKGKKRRKE